MASKERLTEKHYNGKGYYMLCSGVLRCDGKCGDCDELDKLVDRLGEFEDKAENTVEVVRCKDCKHFREPFCIRRDDETHRERINMLTVDFCSYGERKDDGICKED